MSLVRFEYNTTRVLSKRYIGWCSLKFHFKYTKLSIAADKASCNLVFTVATTQSNSKRTLSEVIFSSVYILTCKPLTGTKWFMLIETTVPSIAFVSLSSWMPQLPFPITKPSIVSSNWVKKGVWCFVACFPESNPYLLLTSKNIHTLKTFQR